MQTPTFYRMCLRSEILSSNYNLPDSTPARGEGVSGTYNSDSTVLFGEQAAKLAMLIN